MAALVAERRDHQVGSAVQHLRPLEKVRRRIDEAAEPDHANHLVEIAERGLDLRQQVDRATARRGVALLDGDAGAKLALGDQLAFRVDANRAGHDQQISGAYKSDVIRPRARGLMQAPALCRKFLLNRTRHVSSPFDLTSTRCMSDRVALFRLSCSHMQARADPRRMPKKTAPDGNSYFFVKRP